MGVNPFTLISAFARAVRNLLQPARRVAKVGIGATQDLTRTRSELVAENALLRQQVIVLRRGIRRPRLHRRDCLLLLVLARPCRRWRDALHVANPDTLLRWRRDLSKIVCRRRSRPRGQPMRLAPKVVTLIQTMAKDSALSGAERIRGEFLKLGIRVSKRTIQKYMRHVRPSGSRGQTWSTFIKNHSGDIWACGFLQLYDMFFRPIFPLFFVVHGTRGVVHFIVTRCPTDAWVAQQLGEATPYCFGPRYLIRANDEKFGKRFAAMAEGTEIEVVKILARSPKLSTIRERFVGSVRRECLDHAVILSERQLHPVLREYLEIYFNRARRQQGLCQRIPARAVSRSVSDVGGNVVGFPILGGPHHDYQRAA